MRIEEQWIHRGGDADIPPLKGSLGELLLRRLRERRNPRLQIDAESGRAESAQQVLSRSISVALELRDRGLGPGDMVATATENGLDNLPVMLGCMFAGVIYTPLNPAYDETDFRRMLKLLKPRLVLYSPKAAAALRLALPPGLPAVPLRPDSADWAAFVRPRGAAEEADFRADGSAGPEDTLAILCSSGTTGPPKGVQICQRALYSYLELASPRRPKKSSPLTFDSSDVFTVVSPTFWVSGMTMLLFNLNNDSTTLLYRQFDPDVLLAGVEKYKVTMMFLVPPYAVAMAKLPHLERYDVSSLKFVPFGSAPLSPAVKELLQRRLKKPMLQFYAQTENFWFMSPGPLAMQKCNSIGIPADNVVVKVVDLETGRTVGPHTEGELCVKGPSVFTGYFGNPEATAAAFDSDGWLRTGDLVSFDDDGYFYLHERCKELIKYRGVHLFPAEIEGVLVSHEGVRDAAVAGVDDEVDQERAVGLVVPQPGVKLEAEELHELVRSKLPEYKWLHGGIYFVDEIPRTGTDKVKRRDLRVLARKMCGK